jgi:dipeptidyl aminopeptidase/acylaminoacyl peptidase
MSSAGRRVAPYGSWSSPVTAASLAADTINVYEPRFDGPDVFWLEGRPSDGGRVVVVRRSADGQTKDMTAAPYNVRSRVHEYGGGAYDVADGVLVFSDFADRRVHRVQLTADGPTATPEPITPAGALRYGDLRLVAGGTAVLAVCEDHGSAEAAGGPANRLVRLELSGENADGGTTLVEGHDFFSSPTLSPDGRRLAWLQWDHPNMPWDGSELCLADVDGDGGLGAPIRVAGGPAESVSQPRWAPDGRLVFLSDRTGWWNLYACDVTNGGHEAEPLWRADHDFADPSWTFNMSSYGISPDGQLLCRWLDQGYALVGSLDLDSGERADIDLRITANRSLVVGQESALLVVGYADRPSALVRIDLTAPTEFEVLRTSSSTAMPSGLVSVAEPMAWEAPDGDDVYGFYHPPVNAAYRGPEGELPPLIVMSHGGPTGMSSPVFDPQVQFWTTRGFGVLTVNYRGSSGYGRAYRDALKGRWGVVDVDDCTSGAEAMASQGLADRQRLAIRGGSAGGYTTLAALTFRDVFTAGASLFGIADLEMLARDTHKFESRYLDSLVGPYPAARDLYVERSPIHHVDQIRCPMILLQGRDDPVVPLNQAESMAEAVRAKGLPIALVVFDGEGHGFRRAPNVARAYEAEAYFYGQVFDFQLADNVEPVEIENLSRRSV